MARYSRFAVCSPLTLASEIGARVLRDGGNAADAAVATSLALAVASPHMCGVGGDLLAMVWADGELTGLNSSGALPAAARLPADGRVPFTGIGSATVPGAPAGWRALAERYGTRPLRALAEPAIRLAREGVERAPGLIASTRVMRGLLEQDAEAARVFLADGPLLQPELAGTLEDLDGFSEGPVAARAPEPFAREDFGTHRAEWVTPVRAPFADHSPDAPAPETEVCEMPPNSRGWLACEAIGRLERLGGLDPGEPEFHERLLRAVIGALERERAAGDTIYLCVVDGDGMAVSLNQSLFGVFGSGVVVPGTGVLLHSRGAYHTPETYRGGRKPVHTLSPAMALTNARPRLVFGTMGADAQIQIHLQLLARILVAGQPVEEALAAPRWAAIWGALMVEEGLPPLEPSGLSAKPMPTAETAGFDAAGHAHAILLGPEGLEAGCDPRSDGIPVGE